MYSNKRFTHALYIKPSVPLPGQFRGMWRYFFDRKSAEEAFKEVMAGPDIYSEVQLVQVYNQVLKRKE